MASNPRLYTEENTQHIINRINNIIKKINEENIPGSSNNYIGGMGQIGLPVGGAGQIGLPVGGMGQIGLPVGGAKRTRKKRKDTGKSRTNEWTNFVKAVSQTYNIPYNKALTTASSLRKQGYTIDDLP